MTARDCVLGVWRGLITQPRLFLRHCCRQPPQPQPSPHPPTIFQLLQISPIWLRAIINPTRWHNFWSQSFEQERPFMNKCSSSTYLVSSHYHFQMGVLGIFIITALNLALQSQAFRKMQTKSCICRFLRSGSLSREGFGLGVRMQEKCRVQSWDHLPEQLCVWWSRASLNWSGQDDSQGLSLVAWWDTM